MITELFGKKVGMTQVFNEEGKVVPVTVIEAGPCFVTQVKTKEKDGYDAVQMGFEQSKKATKPRLGLFKKANLPPLKFLGETRLTSAPDVAVGSEIKVDIFEGVNKVDVIGTTKGRGFAGMVRRYRKSRGPESHGSMNVRQPGSIGSSAYPNRVMKGKKMPGHMGNVRRTAVNLEIVSLDKDRNVILVKGAVPGPNDAYVIIRKSADQKIRVTNLASMVVMDKKMAKIAGRR